MVRHFEDPDMSFEKLQGQVIRAPVIKLCGQNADKISWTLDIFPGCRTLKALPSTSCLGESGVNMTNLYGHLGRKRSDSCFLPLSLRA